MNNSKFSPPKPTTGDTAHRVVKSLISPIQGATELFEQFVSPPLDKRLDRWREYVGEALYMLEHSLGFNLEKLQSNEKFITVVTQTTRVAIQNHQKEKLTALRNTIINSALHKDIADDLQLIFIRFIDELTPSHLLLLKFFVEFESELIKLRSYSDLLKFVNSHFEHSNDLARDEFLMLIGDLSTRGLIRVSQDIDDFDDIYKASLFLLHKTNDTLPRFLVTKIAKDFIDFISNKEFSIATDV